MISKYYPCFYLNLKLGLLLDLAEYFYIFVEMKFIAKSIARITVYYLLVFMLLPNGIRHDISQLPALIKHYQHHTNEENEKISLIEFLKMHYHSSSTHKSQENHEDLPWFHHGECPALIFLHENSMTSNQVVITYTHSFQQMWEYAYTYQTTRAIFQPPRLLV